MISKEDRRSSNRRFGKMLKAFRLKRGLLQVDVADATNLNSSYISKIESGKARVTLALLEVLVTGLKTTSSELVDF